MPELQEILVAAICGLCGVLGWLLGHTGQLNQPEWNEDLRGALRTRLALVGYLQDFGGSNSRYQNEQREDYVERVRREYYRKYEPRRKPFGTYGAAARA